MKSVRIVILSTFFYNFWIHENKRAERKNHDKMCWTNWESASKGAMLNQLYIIQLSVRVRANTKSNHQHENEKHAVGPMNQDEISEENWADIHRIS